jgi:hypothetical protein
MSSLTGLFLGAGATYELGMPLVGDVTAQLKASLTTARLRQMNARWRAQGGGHADEVIERVGELFERHDGHYESILGNLETEYIRRGGHGVAQDYYGMYGWLMDAVCHILALRHFQHERYIMNGLRFYRGIADLAEQNNPLWVFSLNHDVLLECIAAEYSIPVSSGFPDIMRLPRRDRLGNVLGELEAEAIGKDQFAKGEMPFFQFGQQGINLLKLHGALDLFVFNDGEYLLKLKPLGAGARGVIAALRAANDELVAYDSSMPGGRWNVTNEIAYADLAGEVQLLSRSLLSGVHKFTNQSHQVLPKQMLAHFQSHLNEVSHLICVGYGLGDIHINQSIREWLGRSADRHLEIVGPGCKQIPNFVLHLARQVSVVDASATDYLARHSRQPFTLREVALKRVRGYVRERGRKKRGWT